MKPTKLSAYPLLLFASLAAPAGAIDERIAGIRDAPELVRTAGIGDLHSTELPAGTREFRLWQGASGGTIYPNELLQLKIDATGKASGTVWWFYPNKRNWPDGEDDDDRRLRQELRVRCPSPVVGDTLAVCDAPPRSPEDWQSLYERLKSLDIETLPDDSELPPNRTGVLDGFFMTVEVRVGTRYRSYTYSNPAYRPEPEARKAAGILEARNRFIWPE